MYVKYYGFPLESGKLEADYDVYYANNKILCNTCINNGVDWHHHLGCQCDLYEMGISIDIYQFDSIKIKLTISECEELFDRQMIISNNYGRDRSMLKKNVKQLHCDDRYHEGTYTAFDCSLEVINSIGEIDAERFVPLDACKLQFHEL
jgi:hypothetical protein